MCSSNIYHCIELVGPIFKMGLKGDIITIANLLFSFFSFFSVSAVAVVGGGK